MVVRVTLHPGRILEFPSRGVKSFYMVVLFLVANRPFTCSGYFDVRLHFSFVISEDQEEVGWLFGGCVGL